MISIKTCTMPAALTAPAGPSAATPRGIPQGRSVGPCRRRCAAIASNAGEEDAHAAVPLEAGNYPSQTPMGQGADAESGGEPAGGLKPSTEAAVKEDLQQASLDRSKNRGRGGGTSGGADSRAEGERQRDSDAPPTSLQLAVGCGLPPGPSGLLGAAEGISYLVVGGIVVWSLARKLGSGSGLPPGPAGLLGAAEGGSWLAALSGLVVLGLQWQAYGYFPSALPDSNCFGQSGAVPVPSFTIAQAQQAASSPSQRLAAPTAAAASLDSQQDAQVYSNVLRVNAASGSFHAGLPQGNLIFSLEAALSQSGAIAETAETAAAAVTAAAAGQPPPAQVQAAVQHLQHRAMQAQQLAAALRHRLIALGGIGDIDQALTAALSSAAEKQVASAPPPTPPAPEPLRFEPPRHKVRAALRSSWTAVVHSDKVHALLAPIPLPATSRHAAAVAAAGVAQEAAESARVAPVHSEKVVASMGRKAITTAISTVKHASSEAAAHLPPPLRHLVPDGLAAPPQQTAPAAAAPAAATPSGKPTKPSSAAASATPGGSPAAKTLPAGSPAAGAAASKGKEAAADSKNVQAVTVGMFSNAFSDLGEGFVGLYQSAKTFDPATTAAVLKERMHQQLPPPAPAPPAAAAAAPAAPSAGTSTTAKAAVKTK
ncbi:hypothetical protein ACK3TF_000201 [Chlorella vulgaris]